MRSKAAGSSCFLKQGSSLHKRPQLATGTGRLPAVHVRAVVAAEGDVAAATEDLSELKSQLLRAVAGLDRGLAATDTDAAAVEELARALEERGGRVAIPQALGRMQGRWRLAFSSGFLSGSLGGRRPGPPAGRLPITLGQVYQRIDVPSQELDNIVTLQLGAPWPLPSVTVTATLAHTFETFGRDGLRIVFEGTSVKGEGPLEGLPPLGLPPLPAFLRPPAQLRSGEFRTRFLAEDMRITRGDRGELRVFVRA